MTYAARDVPAGQLWADLSHRSQQQVVRDELAAAKRHCCRMWADMMPLHHIAAQYRSLRAEILEEMA